MSLMGNHGYDESTDPGAIQAWQDDAEHFAQTVAERLLESARQQRDHERALADRFGWR